MNTTETILWFRTLSNWVGPATALELVTRFLTDTRQDLERLLAISAPEFSIRSAEARQRLHALLGRCGLLGLNGLSQQVTLTLTAVQGGDSESYRRQVETLNLQFQVWVPVLEAVLHTPPWQA